MTAAQSRYADQSASGHQSRYGDLAPTDIAIVAAECRFPGIDTIDSLHERLCSGKPVTSYTGTAADVAGQDSNYIAVGSDLGDVEMFDPDVFGISAREAKLLDPQARILHELCLQALDAAGHGFGREIDSVGVVLGGTHSSFLHEFFPDFAPLGGDNPVETMEVSLGTYLDYLANSVAHRLSLTGPAYTVQTACSTSLVAVHLGVNQLLARESDLVLVGGATVHTPQGRGYAYVPDGPFSEDGLTCPYSADASGAVFTQGAGVVALRRAYDAIDDGDPILAIIRGSAVNNDGGRSAGLVAPSVEAHAEVIHQAQAMADVQPHQVSYLEGHGTGTKVGDPLEISAMVDVFGSAATPWCTVGSCKSVLGHTEAAAGIASLMAVIGALRHRRIPGTVGKRQPSPAIDLSGSALQLAHQTTPWDGVDGRRIAGISSLGFGGTNCHLIVEEAPQQSTRQPDWSAAGHSAEPAVLAFSAATEKSARAMAAAMQDWAGANPDLLADAAWTLDHGRKHLPWRAALAINPAGTAIEAAQPRLVTASAKVLFAFPGGGAQRVGMLEELIRTNATARGRLETIAEEFRPHIGGDIRSICAPEHYGLAETAADDPQLGLPALIAAEIICAEALIAAGIRPDALIGHSTGEYAAAVISGALSLSELAAVIAARSRAFSSAQPGAMVRIRGDHHRATKILTRYRSAEISAFNSPKSTVISAAKDEASAIAQELGEDATVIPVAVAAHSAFVDAVVPIVAGAADSLAAVEEPAVAVFSPSVGRQVRRADLASAQFWAQHVRRPVRFHQTLINAVEFCAGPVVVVNVGPGASLAALAREAGLDDIAATLIVADEQGTISEQSLLAACAEAVASGVPWQGREPDYPRRITLPRYPFDRRRFWPKRHPRQVASRSSRNTDLAYRLYDARLAPSSAQDVAGSAAGVRIVDLTAANGDLDTVVHRAISVLSDFEQAKGIIALGCSDWDTARALGAAIYSVSAETGVRAVAFSGEVSSDDLARAVTQAATAVRGDDIGCYIEQLLPTSISQHPVWPALDTVVILGGRGRVGQALARHFTQQGHQVVIGTRQDGPGHVNPANSADIERLLRAHGCGQSGAVVVATGIVGEDAFAECQLTDSDTVTDHFAAKTDVVAAVADACTRMGDNAPGRVMVMSSLAAHVGGVGLAAYAAANRAAELVTPPTTPTAWMVVASDGWRTGEVNSFGDRLLDNAIDETEAVCFISDLLAAPVEGTTLLTRKNVSALRRDSLGLDSPHRESLGSDSLCRESSRRSDLAAASESRVAAAAAAPVDTVAELVALWRDVLDVATVDESEADFFALGGSSLQATRLLAEVRRRFGVDMRLRDLLANPSLSAMAQRVTAGAQQTAIPAAPASGLPAVVQLATVAKLPAQPTADTSGTNTPENTPDEIARWPLTPVQRAYLTGRQHTFGANSNPCHSFVETLIDDVDINRLSDAVTRVIARHPMLRAIVDEDGHRAIEPGSYIVPVVDCRNHADPQLALERWRARYETRTASATQWPLVTVVAALAPDGVHLGFSIDVLVCDASSFGLFFEELSRAYAGLELPTAPTRHFAEHSRAVAESNFATQHDRLFWKEQLLQLPAAPNLGALPAGNEQFDRFTWTLDEDLDELIHQRARALKVTPTVLFLTAYARALAERTGTSAMTLMLTVFNRPEGFEHVIGDFTTLVPCAVSVGKSAEDDIHGVGESLFEVLDHASVPGPEIIARRSAVDGQPFRLPVVFTSTLGTQVDGGEGDYRLGDYLTGASQTPQVSLDHQVYQWQGRLVAQFDAARSVFASNDGGSADGGSVIEEFVASYQRQLRALAQESAGASLQRPATLSPEHICTVWREILGAAAVMSDSTWSALGGDSLDAIRLVAALRKQGITADIDEILGGITPAELASRELRTDNVDIIRHRDGDAFPLTPLQQAYLVGSQGGWAFSHDSAHFYVDFFDPDATGDSITRAVAALIRHQPMLRAVITDDGQQVILNPNDDALVYPPVEVRDLTQLTFTKVDHSINQIRQTWPTQPIDPKQWPTFRVLVHLLPNGGARVHVRASLLFVDGWSFYLFFDQLFAFADNPNLVLPAPSVSFADYQLSITSAEQEKKVRDTEWWQQRLDDLPEPVRLPLRSIKGFGMRRNSARISADRAEEFFGRCRDQATTPTAVIGAAWARAVSELSGCAELLMTVLYFNRRPLADDIDRVLGPFATTSLVHCKPGTWESAGYEEFAEQLATTLAHSAITGVEVARMISRHRGSTDVVSPVVYTSTLGFGDGAKDATTSRVDESDVYERVVTPQVLLDLQASMENGSIAINLDSPTGAFAEEVTAALLGYVLEEVSAFIDNRSPQTVALAMGSQTEIQEASARTEATQWSATVCAPVSLAAVVEEFSRATGHSADAETNFFTMGGDSLAMVRAIAGLRSRHGLAITPEEFLAQPTAAGVAALARPQLDPEVHVLPLNDGIGEPLYLLHPSGGDVLCYMSLARAIAPRPVYAIADPGLDGAPMPVDLESVASCYGDVIVAHREMLVRDRRHGLQDAGRGLLLGGWSMGGTVAQLLTRMLSERGINVDGLVLVDSNSPDRIRELTGMGQAEVDAEFARRYVRSLQAFGELDVDDSEIMANNPAQSASTVLARQGLAMPGIDNRLSVFTRHLAGLARLTAQPLTEVKTLLAVAGRRSPANSGVGMGVDDAVDDELLGWGTNLPADTTVIVVPGHHYTVLSEPSLGKIAEKMVEMFDVIEATTRGAQ